MRSPMLVDSAKATTAVLAAIVAAPLLGVVLPGTFAYVFWLSVLATLAGVAWVLLRARERGQWPRWTAVALVLVPVLIGTADVVRTVVLYRGVVLPFMRNDMVMNTIEAMTIHNNGSLGSGAEAVAGEAPMAGVAGSGPRGTCSTVMGRTLVAGWHRRPPG